MSAQQVIVQASSRSWQGDKDFCMNSLHGMPIVYWTVKRMIDNIPNANITIASPDFDRNGELEQLTDWFPHQNVSIFYVYDNSPLDRMLEINKSQDDHNYIIRVDGLHLFIDINASLRMLDYANRNNLDCIKMPDDFPIQFTSDIYKIGALRKLRRLLEKEDLESNNVFKVHPKFFMFMRKESFRCEYQQELPHYSDEYLLECREVAKSIYDRPRQNPTEHRSQWSGDQLLFHYDLACKYLNSYMNVLDAGCGYGYGVRKLAAIVSEIHGVDSDANVIETARLRDHPQNAIYHAGDATCMDFDKDLFDAVTCFEVIEHVDPDALLRELKRVLKPEGTLIISTPQNIMGHIPITAVHMKEYRLDEFVDICSKYFEVKEIIGIKAGRIIIPGDPIGSNAVLVCRKPQVQ